MNCMIKAIFLDVDGTLVSFENHKVPRSTVESLVKAREKGVKIIIATGRAFADLSELEGVPYDAVVALNGAECLLRDGTVISRKLISKSDFLNLYKASLDYGFVMAVETDNGMKVNKLSPSVLEVSRMVDHPVPEVVDLEKEFDKGDCCQLCIFCDEETEKAVLGKIPGLAASRWIYLFADINVAGVDKSYGLKVFSDYYGFDISETAAFGDGGNDIPMLRESGIGVAMGGAGEDVIAAADFVTGTVDQDGISNAMKRLF